MAAYHIRYYTVGRHQRKSVDKAKEEAEELLRKLPELEFVEIVRWRNRESGPPPELTLNGTVHRTPDGQGFTYQEAAQSSSTKQITATSTDVYCPICGTKATVLPPQHVGGRVILTFCCRNPKCGHIWTQTYQ
jgi:hypothetical protein